MREAVAAGSLLLSGLLFFLYRSLLSKRLPLPPGPKARLWSGNVHQLPTSQPWLTYALWSNTYGPLVYYHIFDTKVVILNTAKVALDLLESRSAIYSDRPKTWMMGELAGRKSSVFMTPFHSPRFKIYRKALHTSLNPRALQDYEPIFTKENRVLLKSLAQSPEKFVAHIRRNTAAVILKISYGYQVEADDDQFVRVIEEGFRATADMSLPGRFLVESFPNLRFIPEWFPGANFRRLAKELGRQLSRIERLPFEWAKRNIASGNYDESFVSKQLFPEDGSEKIEDKEEEDIVMWCCAALYAGGADTTASALTSFFILMSLYPEVQKQAQAEVERVAGDRLPTPDDQKSMHYVSALIKEVLRWAPVAPLGLRHLVMEDDVYEGYLIPKGTTVIANIWGITHDKEIYPDPAIFDPNRHLGKEPQVDPLKFVFGFGRRACPGAHLAQLSLFLNISSILATFNIGKSLSDSGKEVEPVIDWTTGVTTHLKPFMCRITPRHQDMQSRLGL